MFMRNNEHILKREKEGKKERKKEGRKKVVFKPVLQSIHSLNVTVTIGDWQV
jgi:hypothetical protein